VVVTRNLGLTVAQSTVLRGKMRDAGAAYKVSKNRLAKLALKDTQYEGLEEHLTGPVALAWSTDPIAAAKAAVEFAKTNDKLEIVGGAMGATQLDAAGIKALASMRASTSCAAGSSVWSMRPPPRWRSWSTPRRPSSPVSSAPMAPRKRHKRFFPFSNSRESRFQHLNGVI
jgi:hypothetical protein